MLTFGTMNDIEKAIAYFEDAIRESDEIIAECSEELQKELTEQKGHFVVALEAMREKQEREKGCELCNAERIQIDVHTKSPRDAFFFSSDPAVGLLYCPLCGNRLAGSIPAEQEASQ
jgi:hypothetical protein